MDIKEQANQTPLAGWYNIREELEKEVQGLRERGSLFDASDSDALLKFTDEV